MKKIAIIDKKLTDRIKRIIIETSSPIIPATLIFHSLGYAGITGVYWGLLMGAISVISIELGYDIIKLGSIIVLKKGTVNAEQEKEKKHGS